ncbi:2-dehydro-3-deoxyglucarate aldolase/4-hydroxy-2-oxoheptanedioate aldolase [Rhizobiales bacterium GAS191]|nr:2-dehydro-3-deoxyglucarate aldolase/4-hydroxy-2-oxoheptanedioate aldolase [Rhizobiales bacterium GAS113]SEF09443.1 2-dehydro-3-deoxyglucarate aldolase/4-hydroxy-2-oxoheptanedioate aldolase [Rhizobiales bacterium GAS191]
MSDDTNVGQSMRPNPVRSKLRQGGHAIGPMIFEFFTPGLFAICAQAGADFCLIDMEHSGIGMDTVKAQLAFARGTGVAPFVRVPTNTHHLIAPVLDAGALGIMAPLIETGTEAKALAGACRYRPEGHRGLGFSVAHDDYGEGDVTAKIRAANERTLVIALIESEKGIRNVEDIMAVPGVDVGWLGHYDLTDSMGFPGDFDRPEFDVAVDSLLSACARQGKAAGILATTSDQTAAWFRRGFRCLGFGADTSLFRDALSKGITAIRAEAEIRR